MIRIQGRWSDHRGSAVQWNGNNIDECNELAGTRLEATGQVLTVPDDDGVAPLDPGDWLIKPDDHPWLVSCYESIFPQIFVVLEVEK